MSTQKFYKSPVKKLLKFFEKSRNNWKEKAQTRKKENKRLKNRIRFLDSSKEKWKKEALALRRKLNKAKQPNTHTITKKKV